MAEDSKPRGRLELLLRKYSTGMYERHAATVRTFTYVLPSTPDKILQLGVRNFLLSTEITNTRLLLLTKDNNMVTM
jgi:hypothetical protein